jgi:glycosyltransferase involved in cell wall biosynthesis
VSKIFHFCNSFVGRKGNIGIRTEYILKNLSNKNIKTVCFCRGADHFLNNIEYITMGFFGHIPRLLNALRIYFIASYDHRRLDILLFEFFVFFRFKAKFNKGSLGTKNIAHIWDSCPKLIRHMKSKGYFIILDIPIAPSSYTQRIKNSSAPFLVTHDNHIKIEQECYRHADILIAPSNFVKKELILSGIPGKKIRVIEFGADKIDTIILKDSNNFKSQGVDFCFAGTINLRKGIGELLEVWSSGDFNKDRLHLCGRLFPDIKPLIAQNKSGQILVPGFIDTFDYFSKCNVFVFPSWLEGSAKAIYEAMACGLPVIATDCSGSIVRHKIDGFIIKAGDVKALKKYMLWFKANPKKIKIMGLSARNRVKQYTWDLYSKKITKIYEEVL